MNPEIINRVINLIDKNNERVVLVDPETGQAVVVMDFDAYERMTDSNRQTVVSRASEEKEEEVNIKKTAAARFTPVKEIGVLRAKSPESSIAKEEEKIEEIRSPYPPVSKKKDPLFVPAFSDLTQSELLDKINRDIATWKTVKERKRGDELAAAAQEAVRPVAIGALEEEERFYLEPVE